MKSHSQKHHIPPLPELIKELYRSARRRPGTTIGLMLSKGARLAVVFTETEVAFTMGRPQRRVGDKEEITFKLAAHWAGGHGMTRVQAIEYALAAESRTFLQGLD
jgi:hypothetical protein